MFFLPNKDTFTYRVGFNLTSCNRRANSLEVLSKFVYKDSSFIIFPIVPFPDCTSLTNEINIERPSQKLNDNTKAENNSPKSVNKEKLLTSIVTNDIVFKVQIGASNKKLELVPSNFKGLKNMTMIEGKRIYKYMYQETTDYNEAKQYLKEAKSKGYNSAFLVAFRNGQNIPINDVIK